MANSFFNFKQFSVNQDSCSMKVGTDGVLLGAWAEVSKENSRILDIGTGTGVISLMIAQRNESASIDAIDVDYDAVEQANSNFVASPWSQRLTTYCISLQDFCSQKKYDYIVSNPPYFINSFKAEGMRGVARHTDTLSYSELIDGVLRLLNEEGVFSVILPYIESNIFIVQSALKGLFCNKRMDIKGVADKPIKRVLLQMSRKKSSDVINEILVIETSVRHCYTDKYKELTKNFYLNF